jgi:hypothetical protein
MKITACVSAYMHMYMPYLPWHKHLSKIAENAFSWIGSFESLVSGVESGR